MDMVISIIIIVGILMMIRVYKVGKASWDHVNAEPDPVVRELKRANHMAGHLYD